MSEINSQIFTFCLLGANQLRGLSFYVKVIHREINVSFHPIKIFG